MYNNKNIGCVLGGNFGFNRLIMSDLDDFMMENKPTGKSKLDIYASDILTLKQHGYSDKDVIRFLFEKKGLKVGTTTLARFLRASVKPLHHASLKKNLCQIQLNPLRP